MGLWEKAGRERERERGGEREIRLRALCPPRPDTLGYKGVCDQEEGMSWGAHLRWRAEMADRVQQCLEDRKQFIKLVQGHLLLGTIFIRNVKANV